MAQENRETTLQEKGRWIEPELCFDGLLRDLVQAGGGKAVTCLTGDAPDGFSPKGQCK